MSDFFKYPRTPHLAGSKLQAGDHDLEQVAIGSLTGGTFVWEEKLDGANAAFSFTDTGAVQLQSRGHLLRGGPREGQFALFKAWVETHRETFHRAIGARHVVYGEWCFAKHTVYYDRLPHYFLEFDVLDRVTGHFLTTPARRAFLDGTPIVSVPVVHGGPVRTARAIRGLIRPSLYKSPAWRIALAEAARATQQDVARVAAETDASDLAEGLYLKHERDGRVVGRYKFVRPDFLQTIATSGTHWQERPIIPNRLAPEVDIFAWGPLP
ncbi:MAG: RNA ligase family protein [Rhodospirillales bacterium]|nr:RNA ligase family protein [Rhodospirillales bacterium]